MGCYKVGAIHLEIKEIEKLIENEEIINNQLVKPKRLSLRDTLKFLHTIYSNKMSSQNLRLDTASHGWITFCESIEIRDRIVHPKSSRDLIITQEEQNKLLDASKWFLTISTNLWKMPFSPSKQKIKTSK